MSKTNCITQEKLKEILDYNPDTGLFIWKVNSAKNVKSGHIAGNLKDTGYIRIKINKKMYLAHHLAFLYVYGNFPKDIIDHIDSDRANNKISNLRECSHQQNMKNLRLYSNNSSGHKNVSWVKSRNRWIVQLKVNGKQKYIGSFDNLELADLVAQEARNKYHGEFASRK